MLRTFLSVFFLFLLFTSSSFGQDDSIYSFKADGINLAQAIDLLSRQHNLKFSFASDLINTENQVFFDIKEYEIESLLTEIMNAYAVEFKFSEQSNVLLRKKQDTKALASDSKNIKLAGKIIDSTNGTPIDYAAIAIEKQNYVVFSNADGNFNIDIPAKWLSHNLSIHMLGYEISELRIKDLIDQQENNIEIQSKPIFIADVTILDRPNTLKVAADKLVMRSNAKASFAGGLIGDDILRRMQLLPGIDASDDSSSDIKIRGSNSDETLIIVDGIPLYNSSHYYGIFSAINTDYIKEVNVYKNSQPISLGYKTAGVVELLSDYKIPENTSGQIDLNLLESSILLDVPINASSKISLSGRKSITNISNTSFNSIGNKQNTPVEFNRKTTLVTDPNFGFWDVHAKVQTSISNKSSLIANFYSSVDVFDNTTSSLIRLPNNSVSPFDILSENEEWNTQGASFDWNYLISSDLSINIDGYYTNYKSTAESQVSDELLEFSNNDDEFEQFNENESNNISEKSINLSIEKKLNNISALIGSKYIKYKNEIDINQLSQRLLTEDSQASSLNNYAQLGYHDNNLSLTVGVRNIYYTPTNTFSWSPQLFISFNLSSEALLKGSFSKQYQFQKELSFESGFNRNKEFWVLANDRNIPVSSSINRMIGFNYTKDRLIFDIELYHKSTDNVLEFSPVFLPPKPGDNRPMPGFKLFRGDAINYGLDMTLAKRWTDFSIEGSYSISKSQNSYREINNGEFYPSKNDRRHQLKFIGIYDFKDFSFTSSWIYASGRPYLDREKLLNNEIRGREMLDIKRVQSNLPDYFRIDVGGEYHFQIEKIKTTIGLSIFNVFDRKNVKYQQQLFSLNKETGNRLLALGTNSSLLDRTFNVNFKVSF